MKKQSLCLLALVASTSAFADNSAVTQSRGMFFYSNGYETHNSREEVVERCRNVLETLTSECRENVQYNVQDPYPSHRVVCSTHSGNLPFTAEIEGAHRIELAYESAVNDCKNLIFTDSRACAENISCVDSWQAPPVTKDVVCSTWSTDRDDRRHRLSPFTLRGNGTSNTATAVYEQCSQEMSSSNNECRQNLECHFLNERPTPQILPMPEPEYRPAPPIFVPAPPAGGPRIEIEIGGHHGPRVEIRPEFDHCMIETSQGRLYPGNGTTPQLAVMDARRTCDITESRFVCERARVLNCRR
jgi:hypothetical protein